MRVTDVFGLAVAALIGLLTLAVQPWTVTWWVGIAVSALVAVAAILRITTAQKAIGRRKMFYIFGMIVLGIGSIICAILAFRPDQAADDASAVAHLSTLGWSVKTSDEGLIFEISNKPLPDIQKSADQFSKLTKPFTLSLQMIPSIEGLHLLAENPLLTTISIGAGKFTSLEELRGFTHLRRLGITQVPYEGIRGLVDPTPLSTLINLEDLSLYNTKIQISAFLKPLQKLKTLHLNGTLISSVDSISLPDLEKLDIRDTRVSDLSTFLASTKLSEMTISREQLPNLSAFAKTNLKTLVIIEQREADISSISTLSSIENLTLLGLPRFDFSVIANLSSLRRLRATGFGFHQLAIAQNAQLIGRLARLEELTIGSMTVTDIGFMENLHNLTEVNLTQLPITSISVLSKLPALKKIGLTDIPVVDVSPLLNLQELKEVWLLRIPARADVLTELERKGVDIKRH